MGRSAKAILVLGLSACLVLSLIMKTALNMTVDKQIPLAVKEIQNQFGAQLVGSPSFQVEANRGGLVGRLQVKPLLNSGAERLALRLGHYLWRCCGKEYGITALVVSCDLGEGRVDRYVVNSPRRRGRAIRRLGPDEVFAPVATEPILPVPPSSRKSVPGKRP